MCNNSQRIRGDNNWQNIFNINIENLKNEMGNMFSYFHEYDKEINKIYSKGIKCSKFEDKVEPFESSKILSSLLKIGIPVEYAFSIVFRTVNMIIMVGPKDISTHDIRRIVSNSILTCDLKGVKIEDIEKWGDKYVRRYGRDSQKVSVYYKESDERRDFDYAFIKGTLFFDIVNELNIKKHMYIKSDSFYDNMCEDILDFVNNCNVYSIDYDVLKSMTIQIALQPPHPWFVTDETKKSIIEYDLKSLEKHRQTLMACKDSKNYSNIHYVLCEAIHHASSSILARYNQILGGGDLDAFYNLAQIVSVLYTRSYDDLLIEISPVNELPADLILSGCKLENLYVLLNNIKKRLSNRLVLFNVTPELLSNVIDLCDIAIKIDKNKIKDDIHHYLDENWSNFQKKEILQAINYIFKMIDGLSTNAYLQQFPTGFWIQYKDKTINKPQILVLYIDNSIDWDKLKTYLSNKKIKRYSDTLIIVVDSDRYSSYKDQIDKISTESEYIVYCFTENDLKDIFYSSNRISTFESLLKRDFTI